MYLVSDRDQVILKPACRHFKNLISYIISIENADYVVLKRTQHDFHQVHAFIAVKILFG